MKKQKLTILAISILVIAIVTGGTFAYFSTSERAHNVITTSGVSIELYELTDQLDANGRPVPFYNIADAKPGSSYSKIPQVKNTDAQDVWVRIKVAQSATLRDKTKTAVGQLTADFNTKFWLDGQDGYYYYYRALGASETTEPLFTRVSVPAELENLYNGATFNFDLTAQAVQTANNGNNIYEAKGWPKE